MRVTIRAIHATRDTIRRSVPRVPRDLHRIHVAGNDMQSSQVPLRATVFDIHMRRYTVQLVVHIKYPTRHIIHVIVPHAKTGVDDVPATAHAGQPL